MEQIQLTNSLQQGQITYLLSLLDLSEAQLAKLDQPIVASAYAMLGRRKCDNTSIDAAMCGTRSLHASEIAARERERLRLTLEHCKYRQMAPERLPPCTRLYDVLKQEPVTQESLVGVLHNWAHQTASIRAEHVEEGAMGNLTPNLDRPIAACAHAYARSLAHARLKTKHEPALPERLRIPIGEPNTRGSLQNFLTLTFHLKAEPADLSDSHGYTRLSLAGSGTCSGNLLGASTGKRHTATKNAWLGHEALNMWPFRDPRAPRSLRGGYALSFATRHSRIACRTCEAESESLWHIACDCPNETLTTTRGEIWQSLKVMLIKMLALTERLSRSTAQFPSLSAAELSELLSFLQPDSPLPSPDETRFLLYWGLHAQPWPADVASSVTQRIAYLLGKHFDSICVAPTRTRPLANLWHDWSDAALKMIAKAHHRALPPLSLQPPGALDSRSTRRRRNKRKSKSSSRKRKS